METTFKVGDRVWYWARRKGERAHQKRGTIAQLSEDGRFARVRLEKTEWYDDGYVTVQSVETKRLREWE